VPRDFYPLELLHLLLQRGDLGLQPDGFRLCDLALLPIGYVQRRQVPTRDCLTLDRFVAGSGARAKARRLGIIEETQEAEERRARAAVLTPRRQTVRLLGRDILVPAANDGTLRAKDDGKPASAKCVQRIA
jgi:hypothetical protein